ncbi:uncharacterized protein LOC130688871 isoform X1 [Daphnia carinata]|uniref:uncharacterized protein LOC130688871 isoform X1 n=1 Tax=Daphnia carinata TaxID=120202 RepID=UPI002580A4C2|nr:uncharacterized protein LOC130688871 isoform X1 [Daphnia carinata]
MKYSVVLIYTCVLVAMANGHWKNKGTGKCRVQSESKAGKSPSWEWVDCVYSNGDLIMISTTKRPTTTQKPLKIDGQFKKRGPGKCLIKSETEKTKKGNQPAWVWVDCDYSSGRPQPITSKPPAVKTTTISTTSRPVVPVPSLVQNQVRPQIPAQVPVHPSMQVPAQILSPVQVPVQVRPAIQVPVQVRPPMQVPAQVRPPMQVPAQARPPMQVPSHVRPPAPVPAQVRPPMQAPPQVRPSTPAYYPAWPSVQAPLRPPAPFPFQPAPVPPRPPTPAPTPSRPPMSSTSRSVPVATTQKTSSTTASNEVCKGRWCWNGTIWTEKGKSSTERTLNIFKKPTLP